MWQKVYWWYSLDWPSSYHKRIIPTSDDIDPIYLPELQLSQASASTTEVGYLGIQITFIGILSNAGNFVLQFINIHISSTIPKHIVKGVLNGQLTRYGRLCSQPRHFAYNAARLIPEPQQ